MRIRQATGLIAWCLRRAGRWGVCLPPVGVFVLEEHRHDMQLLRHEAQHWKQYQELGAPRYYARYLWLLARHGYQRHPMEIEANHRSRK